MFSPDFLIAALVVVLIPGTGVLYTLATGISRGARASVFAALGCTLGILPAIVAALLGLSALLYSGALVYMSLKYAGAAYLIYLAIQTWRDRGPVSFSREVPARSTTIIRTGVLINVLNPKLSIFFLAFLPQFIDPAANVTTQMLGMSAVFMTLTFAVFGLYGVAAGLVGDRLRRPHVADAIRIGAAAAFGWLGARLALAETR